MLAILQFCLQDDQLLTISSLTLYSIQNGNCVYVASTLSTLYNTTVIYDLNQTLSPKCASAEVSFSSSLSGSFANVILIGNIYLMTNKTTKLFLSRFVGHIFDFSAQNCSSDFKYFLNGETVIGAEGIVVFDSNFDGAVLGVNVVKEENGAELTRSCEDSGKWMLPYLAFGIFYIAILHC
ncbi:Hypothetical_protein [Hexamita inflata]|uniref:Hypothetical_protein n=1 Tax=Hexamita inflata TaxID=28002 RepID=A0AA86U423_9EUKA|nr:Hypothetical protein HINF_LOCUS29235 [Hexamita inflata]